MLLCQSESFLLTNFLNSEGIVEDSLVVWLINPIILTEIESAWMRDITELGRECGKIWVVKAQRRFSKGFFYTINVGAGIVVGPDNIIGGCGERQGQSWLTIVQLIIIVGGLPIRLCKLCLDSFCWFWGFWTKQEGTKPALSLSLEIQKYKVIQSQEKD